MVTACSLALVWSSLAAGDPLPKPASETSLAGRWLLTMPAGFEYDARLESVEAGLYRLRCGALNLQGLYELRGKTLVLVEADNPHLAGLTWKVLNTNTAVLTTQPNQSKVGSDYRGATLGRQKPAAPRQPKPRGPRASDSP